MLSTALLLGATVASLALANSPWREAWLHFWHLELGLSLLHWVNDGLMTIFFFLIGLELKQELTLGQLASRRSAMLPVFGALGGMVAPAAIYLALQPGGEAVAGWGIPMATDIAFAVAALAVLGARVDPALRIFLLALAIVDDLGAVTVIALFYTAQIQLGALAGAGVGLAAIYGIRRAGVRSYLPYLAVGTCVWGATLVSGVHATVAGVLLGLLTPVHALAPGEESPLEELSHWLHPWVSFAILPVFALANAGVTLEASTLGDPASLRVALAVALGLLLGKPLGIALFALAAARLGVADLPKGTTAGAILGLGLLGGIGFTMSLFITALAFGESPLAATAKLGVFVASVLAAAGGVALLARTLPRVR